MTLATHMVLPYRILPCTPLPSSSPTTDPCKPTNASTSSPDELIIVTILERRGTGLDLHSEIIKKQEEDLVRREPDLTTPDGTPVEYSIPCLISSSPVNYSVDCGHSQTLNWICFECHQSEKWHWTTPLEPIEHMCFPVGNVIKQARSEQISGHEYVNRRVRNCAAVLCAYGDGYFQNDEENLLSESKDKVKI
ncbi:hypothetical protein FPQ18DRAFT_303889 [Pyronema domesticum]|nr:hypothetical protein FPQ18DRAFT_303889 [Pyronema domesticum]